MIRDTRAWNLYLAIDMGHIDILGYCTIGENSLLTAGIPLDTEAQSHLIAVQEAVYDNPLLLNEFNKVTVVNRGGHHTLMPTDIAHSDIAGEILTEITGKEEGESGRLIVDELPLLDISMCHFMEEGLYNFMRRTFNGVKFIHSLSVLTRYFHGTMRAAGSRCSHVNVRSGCIDIVIYSGDTLLLANSYRCTEPTDALYYIIATRRALGIDSKESVILSGDRDAREALMPLLREYLPTVIPAIFPAAMFRAGGQKAMEAPADLIYMPLCE